MRFHIAFIFCIPPVHRSTKVHSPSWAPILLCHSLFLETLITARSSSCWRAGHSSCWSWREAGRASRWRPAPPPRHTQAHPWRWWRPPCWSRHGWGSPWCPCPPGLCWGRCWPSWPQAPPGCPGPRCGWSYSDTVRSGQSPGPSGGPDIRQCQCEASWSHLDLKIVETGVTESAVLPRNFWWFCIWFVKRYIRSPLIGQKKWGVQHEQDSDILLTRERDRIWMALT